MGTPLSANASSATPRAWPSRSALWTFRALALAGCPFFSGFVSKDQILTAAFVHEPLVYGLLAFTALLTAFYTTRLCVIVFLPRPGGPGAHHGEDAVRIFHDTKAGRGRPRIDA